MSLYKTNQIQQLTCQQEDACQANDLHQWTSVHRTKPSVTLKPPAARGMAGIAMGELRFKPIIARPKHGWVFSPMGVFWKVWPAPVSASLAIYTNVSHLFFRRKQVHTAGEESIRLFRRILVFVQVTTWSGLQKGDKKHPTFAGGRHAIDFCTETFFL